MLDNHMCLSHNLYYPVKCIVKHCLQYYAVVQFSSMAWLVPLAPAVLFHFVSKGN